MTIFEKIAKAKPVNSKALENTTRYMAKTMKVANTEFSNKTRKAEEFASQCLLNF